MGRQTTAFVLSFDTAEGLPLTSSVDFSQRSETAHLIDVGSTVLCLVRGQAVVDPLMPALGPTHRGALPW